MTRHTKLDDQTCVAPPGPVVFPGVSRSAVGTADGWSQQHEQQHSGDEE